MSSLILVNSRLVEFTNHFYSAAIVLQRLQPYIQIKETGPFRWGLATSALRDVPLPTAASSVGLLKIQDFTPQGASNTVQSPTTAMALDKRALQLDLERIFSVSF